MSTARQNFFVYATTTYVRSKKWDALLRKIPFDSSTCSEKLTNNVVRGSNFNAKRKGELACKPGSVEDNHSSRSCVTAALKQPTRKHAGPTLHFRATSLFGLAPGGVCRAVECCHRRGALLPHHFTLASTRRRVSTRCFGGLLSVALSVGSRPPGVTWHLVHWSPDFPPLHALRHFAAIARPAPRAHLIRPRACKHSGDRLRRRRICPTARSDD